MTIEERKKDYLKIILRLKKPQFKDIRKEITQLYDISKPTIYKDLKHLRNERDIIKKKKRYFCNKNKKENLEILREYFKDQYRNMVKTGQLDIDKVLNKLRDSDIAHTSENKVSMVIDFQKEMHKKIFNEMDLMLYDVYKKLEKNLEKEQFEKLTIGDVFEKLNLDFNSLISYSFENKKEFWAHYWDYLTFKEQLILSLRELEDNLELRFSELHLTKYPEDLEKKDQIKKVLIQARKEKIERLLKSHTIQALLTNYFQKEKIKHLKTEISDFLNEKLKDLREIIPFRGIDILNVLGNMDIEEEWIDIENMNETQIQDKINQLKERFENKEF